MGQIVVVTSLKGGVGKTVFSAGLSYELAQKGLRVLAIDLDLGTGGLDIAMGRENSVLPTFPDLVLGNARVEDCLFPGDDGVFFLSSPVFFNEATLRSVRQENFNELLSYLKANFDFIIFDMPAGGGAAFPLIENSCLADITFLVTTSAPTSVRAAERCAMRLREPDKIKLILNCYHLSQPRDNAFSIVEIIHRASVPIFGVIPFDPSADSALARGVPLTVSKRCVAGKAITNVARRLQGESVPLFDGVMRRRKKIRFY